jgi:hypothetical protein
MPAARHLTLETVNIGNTAEVDALLDQVMKEGMSRVQAECAELRAKVCWTPMAGFQSPNCRPACARDLIAISADDGCSRKVHRRRAVRRGEGLREGSETARENAHGTF